MHFNSALFIIFNALIHISYYINKKIIRTQAAEKKLLFSSFHHLPENKSICLTAQN